MTPKQEQILRRAWAKHCDFVRKEKEACAELICITKELDKLMEKEATLRSQRTSAEINAYVVWRDALAKFDSRSQKFSKRGCVIDGVVFLYPEAKK